MIPEKLHKTEPDKGNHGGESRLCRPDDLVLHPSANDCLELDNVGSWGDELA